MVFYLIKSWSFRNCPLIWDFPLFCVPLIRDSTVLWIHDIDAICNISNITSWLKFVKAHVMKIDNSWKQPSSIIISAVFLKFSSGSFPINANSWYLITAFEKSPLQISRKGLDFGKLIDDSKKTNEYCFFKHSIITWLPSFLAPFQIALKLG